MTPLPLVDFVASLHGLPYRSVGCLAEHLRLQEQEFQQTGSGSCWLWRGSGVAPYSPYCIGQSHHSLTQIQPGARDATFPWEKCQNYVAVLNLPYLPFSLKLAFVLYIVLVHLSLPPTFSKREQKKEKRLCSCLGHSWRPGICGNRD